jgi:hypothetical protein
LEKRPVSVYPGLDNDDVWWSLGRNGLESFVLAIPFDGTAEGYDGIVHEFTGDWEWNDLDRRTNRIVETDGKYWRASKQNLETFEKITGCRMEVLGSGRIGSLTVFNGTWVLYDTRVT